MGFEFATATRIVFGPGTVGEVAPAAREMGGRALLVTGRSQARATPLLAQLKEVGITCFGCVVHDEPSVDLVRRALAFARKERCDLVIALGGGSTLDAGKAIAALLTNRGELMDYLEVIGKAQPLTEPSAPFIAVPTTAGTGTEVTRNAVLASPEHRVKVSVRSPLMLARLAVIDPELTYGLPPEVTARTGLDALTQLIEPYVSTRANPLTDGFCLQGMKRVSRSLRRACQEGEDPAAREDMAAAALLSGLALANAGLGVVHGFAGPIGGMFPAPHGAVCAALLPGGMETNIQALHERAPHSEALRRYGEIGRVLTGRPDARAEDGVAWVKQVCRDLVIPPLRSHGIGEADFPLLVARASQASSMKANPIVLTAEELRAVLDSAL
jgi:alcohol dehydrogenase class IV